MKHGVNTTYVQYALVRASCPLVLELKALVNYRDFHSTTYANGWQFDVDVVEHGLRVAAFPGATPFYLLSATATAEPAHHWYRNFDLARERARGLEDREDHLHAGTFHAQLARGEAVTIVLSTDPAPSLDGRKAREARRARERRLLACWARALPRAARQGPAWIRQLVLAADQFIVARSAGRKHDGGTIIAGYPWFGEWGRDTMVSLPGLALSTGRPEIARRILRTWARYADRGMLPNRFPDRGHTPEYNTADAALWYFEAVRQYYARTGDRRLLRELFSVLADIIDWHARGTRYGIRVDPADGLLRAGEEGLQLTWMDAKVDEWVVTPRVGKPIEVNALWLNALVSMSQFARLLKKPAGPYEAMGRKARVSFQRFWNEAADYCFDVIDGPGGNDASLRPNQIFAVALPVSPLTRRQQRAVVDACARHLLTPYGLRTLEPAHLHYHGHYAGPPRDRDAAYHEGTAWGWLLGPFALAHLRVYKDPARARAFLESFEDYLEVYGVGTASEIFDADLPHKPQGCIAQAWTVAEILRAWHALANLVGPAKRARTRKR